MKMVVMDEVNKASSLQAKLLTSKHCRTTYLMRSSTQPGQLLVKRETWKASVIIVHWMGGSKPDVDILQRGK